MINFAARLVTGSKRRDHITPVLKSLHWSRIGELVEERDRLKVHRAICDPHAPIVVQNMFKRRCDVATRDTRLTDTEQVHLPKVRLIATQKHFMYRAGSAWNRLPREIQDMSSIFAFKRAIRPPRNVSFDAEVV